MVLTVFDETAHLGARAVSDSGTTATSTRGSRRNGGNGVMSTGVPATFDRDRPPAGVRSCSKARRSALSSTVSMAAPGSVLTGGATTIAPVRRRHPQGAGGLQRPPRLVRRQLRLSEPHGRAHQGVTRGRLLETEPWQHQRLRPTQPGGVFGTTPRSGRAGHRREQAREARTARARPRTGDAQDMEGRRSTPWFPGGAIGGSLGAGLRSRPRSLVTIQIPSGARPKRGG